MQLISAQAADRSILGLPPLQPVAAAPGIFASVLRSYLHAKQHGCAAQAAAYQAMAEDRNADAEEAFAASDEAFLRASDMRALAWPA